jgi:serine protease Do
VTRAVWTLLLLLALLACSTKRGSGASPSASASAPPLPATLSPPPPVQPGVNAPLSFASLAERADPAVVFIKTLQEQRGRTGRRRVVGEGLGSAFVFDPGGLILTNNHVIEHATDIRVIFGSSKEMEAKVVGRDPPTDIAVLRVESKDLPHLPLGDSDSTRVGDWVVAIGNPFGLAHTVSAGIISAKGRTGQDVKGLGDGTGYYNFIQTDASINPGNSGGPLLDLAGRVVGINTAIRARANSIGFAIPINMVKELLPHLTRDGKVRRSAIGIRVSSLVAADMPRLNLPGQQGALVRSLTAGGPGDRAGLQVDDVILAFDGQPVSGPEKLRWLASLAGIGKTVNVRVQRGNRTIEVKVVLGELPELPAAEVPSGPEEEESPFGFP